jgi:hypothetical protein
MKPLIASFKRAYSRTGYEKGDAGFVPSFLLFMVINQIFLLTKRFRQEIKGILVLRKSVVPVNGIDKLNR